MHVDRSAIYWNYGATFLKMASGAILLPFILRLMPAEKVAIWSLFTTITSFALLLDFGFQPSFARNVTYVFSGVKTLRSKGFVSPEVSGASVDYGLLNGLLAAMKWFYFRIAATVLLVLATAGTVYIYTILRNYHDSHQEVYIAWGVLCLLNSANLFTLYYDALLQGKGMVKRAKQIAVISQLAYLILALLLTILGFGLIAIVSSQAVSILVSRTLARRAFFTREMDKLMSKAATVPTKDVLRTIFPNSAKMGLTSLGGFMIQKSALLIGSIYLPLAVIASYSITIQLINVIAGLAGIYVATYGPRLSHLRVVGDLEGMKKIYLKSQFVTLSTFLFAGLVLVVLGPHVLALIGSKTVLLPATLTLIALATAFEQTNMSIAGDILLTKNEVPFFKPSLVSGICTIVLLIAVFSIFDLGILTMLLVPLAVDLSYQAWKWPWQVKEDLGMSFSDLYKVFRPNMPR
ncbi:MAG TPA: O-unit flippase-like protein [Chryseolinea sp.]|nr:O-unit flippase-like protein [Chryseolinea sp.]